MKTHIKSGIGLIGLLLCFGHGIIMYLTFLKAYTHNYQTQVMINMYNEADIEFIVIPITLILGLYGVYRYSKKRC